MASTVNQQQSFPAVPPSLSAGDHEMRDYYAPQDVPRPTMNQTPYLKPYLGLRARLSQIWINRWTILLLLILVRLLFAIASTDSSLTSARREALSACTNVETVGSTMASMPHYMANGVNEMTAASVEKAVHGLMKMLELSVTAVENIVLMVVAMLTDTYLCLITLAVRGSMKAAVEIGDKFNEVFEKTVNEVTDEMGDKTKDVTDGINKIMDGVNFALPGDFEIPEINLDDQIKKLKGLEAPPEILDGINELNESIPTFDEVKDFVQDTIRIPFEKLKDLISNKTSYEFDRSLLPVPQKEVLNFCSEGNSINEFFDDLLQIAYQARKIGLGVLIALAIIVCIPMAYIEIRRYRKMEEHSALFADGHEPMDVVYIASRPTTGGIGLWLGRRFGSARRQAIMRWAWAYATSVPMLFLLSLGLAGLFSCFCQYLVLRGIQQKVPELTDQVADFAGKVVTSLNNASMAWSGGVNSVVADLDDDINNDMLGWVDEATTSINDTLNAFVEKTNDAIEEAFGDTILSDVIQDVLRCLVGLKIESFQKGLTWVKENAHVNFPGVPKDALSLKSLADSSGSDSASDLLANPSGEARDGVTEAIDHVIEKLLSGIQTEALISTVLILMWLLTAIGGLIYASTHLARRDPPTGTAYNIDPAIDNTFKAQDHPSDPAPAYEYHVNKAAPYTLQPRPFQSYPEDDNDENEKVGHVGARTVTASARPGHLRASSHGQLAEPSPLEEKRNPFSDR